MAWLWSRKILGLYVNAPAGYTYAYVSAKGWMLIRGDNPHGEAMVSTALAQAWHKSSYVNIYEYPTNYIYTMYTF